MSEIRLLHYSSKPIAAVSSCDQAEAPHPRPQKPWGLWVSVEGEDDWRSWCEAESFGDPAKQLCYSVTLAPNANILRIATNAALLAFNSQYGFDPYEGRGYSFKGSGVRWASVAEKYDGIIIAPYLWELRLDDRVDWYYSWDCASGCIWNSRAVAALELAFDPSWSTPQAVESVALTPKAPR